MLLSRSVAARAARRCRIVQALPSSRGVAPLRRVAPVFSVSSPPHGALAFSTVSTVSSADAVLPWQERPKLVILGVGWAALNVIKNLDERAINRYNILVCSPTNHFVNTPLLPSVTVGTLGPRAIVEPIRHVIAKHRKNNPNAHIKFNEVEATEVDTKQKRIRVSTRGTEGRASFRTVVKSMPSATVQRDLWIDYDVMVCAVGATTNTFGTPGALENCTFLKTVQDAMKIRTTLLDCFETAAELVKEEDEDEIDRLLRFVVVGAGPTGVEIAAEIRDFVKEDVIPHYSGFKDREIKIQVVEMTGRMLGTYDKLIQKECAKQFKKNDIEMLTEHQVKKVNQTSVEVLDLKAGELKELPFGMCVWASGVRPNSVSLDIARDLQGARMLEVDGNLRARGAEGSIFGLGDCAKITMPTLKAHAKELFEKADKDNSGDLDIKEFTDMIEQARKDFPHLEAYLGEASKESISRMYQKADHDKDSKHRPVTLAVFEEALAEVDRELKMLPPTAQVAAQQGEYLAKILNTVPYKELGHESGFTPVFEYNHMGSMAYIGGESAAIDSPIFGVSSGLLTYVLWKGIYWGKSVSLNMKVSMCFDWAKSWFLGRDTSRL